MFVVLADVNSVEEALAQATCQMCLNKHGAADRDLYKILLGLGCESPAPATPSLGGFRTRPGRSTTPTLEGTVILGAPARRPDGPSTVGLSIEMSRHPSKNQPPSVRDRKVVPLKGAIADMGSNTAVLEVAKQASMEREQAMRAARAERFDKIFLWLRLTLARIRKQAGTGEVWNQVEIFKRKLSEAVEIDPKCRGVTKLLAEIGTSREELESLCLMSYDKPFTRKRLHGAVCEKMDAFEGGRRPESWDAKGGRKPAFYEFEVVRPKSSSPIPNSPLTDGNDKPRPKVIYSADGQFGPRYKIQNSTREPSESDQMKGPPIWAVAGIIRWANDHPDVSLRCNGCPMNLLGVLCLGIQGFIPQDDQSSAETDSALTSVPEHSATMPHVGH
jgi:hypothetical protein